MYLPSIPDFINELVYRSYLQAAPYLKGPDAQTRDLSLAQELFTALHIQWERWPRVTVTGSKGKGSTAAMLASILQAHGECVGFVSSPELRRFNERIRINGVSITDEQLHAAALEIASVVQAMTTRISPPRYVGPGAIILALAAKAFERANVSMLVVEAGRGGEFDEARLLKAPLSIITPIMLEHTDALGPTLQDIARTKTYIAAPDSTIICAPQHEEVQEIINRVACTIPAAVCTVSSEITIKNAIHTPAGVVCELSFTGETKTEQYQTTYKNLYLPLAGIHQTNNLATAVLAAYTLLMKTATQYRQEDIDRSIYKGVQSIRWPGRATVLQQQPWVVVDGAITRESTQAICALVRHYPAQRIIAVVGVPLGKDLDGICAELAHIADEIILTEVPYPKFKWYDDAVEIAARYCPNVQRITPAEQAFTAALTRAQTDDGIILVGTQMFVGCALDFWKIDTDRIY